MRNTYKIDVYKSIIMFVFISLTILMAFRGEIVISDPFHTGEFFASAESFTSNRYTEYPLTIHGALDFIPSLIAQKIFSVDNFFVYTILFYKVLNIISIIFFMIITNKMLHDSLLKYWLLLVGVLIAPFLVNYRDLFFMLTFLIYLVLQDDHKYIVYKIFYQIIFGAIVGLGLFWSFDRGIATFVIFGIASLYIIPRDNSFIFSLLSFLVTILFVSFVFNLFPISYYYENLLFLIKTSSQWSLGAKPSAIILSVFAICVNLLTLYLYAKYNNFKNDYKQYSFFLVLVLTSLLCLKIATNRADYGHIVFAFLAPFWLLIKIVDIEIKPTKILIAWSIVLIVSSTILVSIIFTFKSVVYIPFILINLMILLFVFKKTKIILNLFRIFIVVVLLYNVYLGIKSYMDNDYVWLSEIKSIKSNFDNTSNSMKWIANNIKHSKTDCIFDLTNNGIINGLTKLPSCTKYTYPVYANESFEKDLIDSLNSKKPQMIVYSTSFWSYNIDNRNMKVRFPALEEYIQQNYNYKVCKYNYCLRFMYMPDDLK